jgi:hypothetical protein
MSTYSDLKKIWKTLGIKAHIVNYSSVTFWVVEGNEGVATAYLLPPMTRSPEKADVDGFKRVDGKPVMRHKSWWKVYDGSFKQIFDKGGRLSFSENTMTRVTDSAFSQERIIYDKSNSWAIPIKLITDVERDKKKKIIQYFVSNVGWIDLETTLKMTCYGEISNARPVFPENGAPYLRTRRDKKYFNNLEAKG